MTQESGRPVDSGPGWQTGLRAAGPYMGLGLQLAGSMLLYVIAGYFLDRWLGTEPWLLIVGAVVGMISFFVQLALVVRRLNVETAQRARETKRKAEDEAAD